MTDDLDVDVGRSQLRLGVLVGVAAYVVGFLAMFLPGPIANPRAYAPEDVVNETINEEDIPPGGEPSGAPGSLDPEFPVTETIDSVNSAAAVFYNAHFVDVLVGFQRRPSLSRGKNVLLDEVTNDTTTVSVLRGEEAEIVLAGLPAPPILFFLVPVVLLILSGVLINELSGGAVPTPETAITSGSAAVLGYLPLAILVASIVRFREPRIIFGGIDLLGAILIAGIVYPVVFGGLGGYVWFVTRSSGDADSESSATEDSGTIRRSGERSPGNHGAAGPPRSAGGRRSGEGNESIGVHKSGGGHESAGGHGSGGAPRNPSVERVAMTDDLAFDPDTVVVAPGDVVRWENEGSLTFTVTAYEETIPRGVGYFASGRFESEEAAREAYPEGGIGSGESYEHVFNTPGTYEYFCVPQENAGMTGTVEVRRE